MKLYLLNDTSGGHAGSRAVMRSLHHRLRRHEIICTHHVHQKTFNADALEKADAVVVNGEGTIHHRATAANFLMEFLDLSHAMGKRTFLINTVFQNERAYYPRSLAYLDFCSVREPLSYRNIMECGAKKARILLDSCADPHFLKVPPKVRGSGVAKGETHPQSAANGILDALDGDAVGLASDFNDVIARISGYGVYVTGQHHGVYAAGLSGTPFVPVPSNSHKIEGLIEWSGLPIDICRREEDLPYLIEKALDNRTVFQAFNNFLRSKSVFLERHFEEGTHNAPFDEEIITVPFGWESMAPLHRKVSGRTVSVILGGESVAKVDPSSLRGTVTLAVNNFPVIEREVLKGENVDIAAVFSQYELERLLPEIRKFIRRQEDNVLLTSNRRILDKEKKVKAEKIAGCPSLGVQINSLANVIVALIHAGASEIVLYGLDGVKASGLECAFSQKEWKQTYFASDTYPHNRPSQLMQETHWLDRLGARLVEEAKRKSGNQVARVYNANADSQVTAFPFLKD